MKKHGSRRSAVLPLGIKNRAKTELPALVALAAIGEDWFSEQQQADLLVVALVVLELAEPDSLQEQCATELKRLCEQTITIDNKVDIALNLAECLPWLQLQPNSRIDQAVITLAARNQPSN